MICKREEINCKFCCKHCEKTKKMFCKYNCEKEPMKCDDCPGKSIKTTLEMKKFSSYNPHKITRI